MSDFHFLRPELLWSLLVVVVIIILLYISTRKAGSQSYIAKEMNKWMISSSKSWNNTIYTLLPVATICLIIIAIAGPVWERRNDEVVEKPTSISLVINISKESNTQHIERFKTVVYDLLDSLETASVSLIVQGGSSHILVPYTSDYRLIRTYTELLSPNMMPITGDNIEALKTIAKPANESLCHSIIYLTSNYTVEKHQQIIASKTDANTITVLTLNTENVESSSPLATIIPLGIDNQAVGKVCEIIKQACISQIENAEMKNQSLWIDRGYLLCFPIALILLPLFRRKNIALLFALSFITSSCSYTNQKGHEALSNYYLLSGDTLKAIQYTKEDFKKGCLLVEISEYEKAINAFEKIETDEANYNKALAIYMSGDIKMALVAFKALQQKRPDWLAVQENIERIEQYLIEINKNKQKKTNDYDQFDSYQKDKEKELDGTEEELWANKLDDFEGEMKFNHSQSNQLTGDVLYRQIENNPKEFLRKRLKYEYERR
jgi:Ca-activated chloride channel family protein